jgi:hypothetical protein
MSLEAWFAVGTVCYAAYVALALRWRRVAAAPVAALVGGLIAQAVMATGRGVRR